MRSSQLADFGNRVREARLQRQWTQRDLAERCGLGQSEIWSIESGQRDIRLTTFIALKEALELPASELVDDLRH